MNLSPKFVTGVNLVVNYTNMAFAILVNIVLVPYYLKFFSIDTYGAWIATGGIIGMLGLLDGGINLTLTQKLCAANVAGDRNEFSKYFIAGGTATTLLTLLIPVICWILGPFIGKAVNFSGPDLNHLQNAFLVAGIATFFSLGTSTISTAFQAWGLVHQSGLVSIAILFIGVGATILGLHLGMGVIALPFGAASRALFGFSTMLLLLLLQWRKQNLPIFFSKSAAKEMIGIGAYLSGGRIFESLAANSENLIIANVIDPKAVAIWTLSTRAISLAAGFLNPIGSSLFTSMAGYMAKCDAVTSWIMVKKIVMSIATVAGVFFGVAVAMNASFVNIWVGPANHLSQHIDFLAAFAFMLSQRSSMLSLIATAMGHPKIATNIVVAGGISSIGVLYVTSHHLGVLAIPLSRILVQVVLIMPFFIIAYHRLFQQDRKSVMVEFIRSYLLPLTTISFGALFSYFVTIENDWIIFLTYSLISFLSIITILLVIFPSSRNLFRIFFRSFMVYFNKVFRLI